MAFFIVNKSDLNPDVLEQLGCICESRTETKDTFIFEPKSGFLVSLGTMLLESKVSYHLEFGHHISQMSLSKKQG